MKYTYVDPKEWNTTLTSYTGGLRARYWSYSYSRCKFNGGLPEGVCQDFEYVTSFYKGSIYGPEEDRKQNKRLNDHKALFTITLNRENFATIKVALINPEGKLISASEPEWSLHHLRAIPVERLYEKVIDKEKLRYFRFDFKAMLTPPTAESISKASLLKHKDRFGVEIEIGDYVAHPCGSYGGGSWVDICQIPEGSINENTVNGWKPERLIVVRTANPNKKLGWL